MSSETEEMAQAFVALRLPKEQWTHQAHLRVGLWHLLHHPAAEALDLLRARICAYNEATGGINTDTAGYHETITRFYVWVIETFLATAERTRPIDVLAQDLVERHGDRGLPLSFWSRELLFSTTARRDWVEPDLQPLTATALRQRRAAEA